MTKRIEQLCQNFHEIIEQYGEMMINENEAIAELEQVIQEAKNQQTIDTQDLYTQTTQQSQERKMPRGEAKTKW